MHDTFYLQMDMALDPVCNCSISKTPKQYLFFGKNGKLELQDENQQGYLQGQRGGGQNLSIIDARFSGIQWQVLFELGTLHMLQSTESMRHMVQRRLLLKFSTKC